MTDLEAKGGAKGHDGSGDGTRFVKGTLIPKPSNLNSKGIIAMLKQPLNVLLILVPLGMASHFLGWGDMATFWLNFAALIPLAKLLGDATEELAAGLKNDMLAGILNATFGNAVEMVITIQSLRAGLLGVVKASLLGSVLSNILLVLGMSFFFGGILNKYRFMSRSSKHEQAHADHEDAEAKPAVRRALSPDQVTLEELSEVGAGAAAGAAGAGAPCPSGGACLGLMGLLGLAPGPAPTGAAGRSERYEVPDAAHHSEEQTLSAIIQDQARQARQVPAATETADDASEDVASPTSFFVKEKVQKFQVMTALVNMSLLLLACLCYGLVTVMHAIVPKGEGSTVTEKTLLPVSRICSVVVGSSYIAYIVFQLLTHSKTCADDEGDDDDDSEPHLSIPASMGMLAAMTVIVAISSEFLVDAIVGVTATSGMSEHFIGVILLPIVGNACEHAAAVRFAIQDKPGLAVGIAVGSSTQISLLVIPFSVIAGWMIHQPMDLNFGALNTAVMTLSVLVVFAVLANGASNWLHGYLLMAAYLIVGILYWYLPSDLDII